MKRFIKYFVLYVLYVVLLFICYKIFISKVYDYNGFYVDTNDNSSILSLVLLSLSFFVIIKQKTNTYSKLIIYILFVVNYIPSLILYYYMPQDIKYIFLLTLYWIVAIISVNLFDKIRIKKRESETKTQGLKIKTGKLIYAVLVVELIVALLTARYTGINIGFSDVYELRYNYLSIEMPKVLVYLFMASKVINPILFIYLRKSGKKHWAVLSFFVQLFLFLCDGSKSALFSLLIAMLISSDKIQKKKYNYLEDKNFSSILLGGMASINVVGLIEYLITKSGYIYTYFIRRLFFVPAFLHMKYYDFFSNNSADFFRQSILGKIGLTSSYTTPIPSIIGARYFGDSAMLANNGLFSDGYSNLGAIGVIVMPILLVITLRFLDISAKDIKPLYIVTILISVPYTFLSSLLFTTLLTHGFIFLCLILKFVIPKEKVGDEK